jgi:CheY-like chemotaxis protein
MDIDPISNNFYRYKFREFLEKKAESSPSLPRRSDVLYADIFTREQPQKAAPPAPQDLGEIKQHTVDENLKKTDPNPQGFSLRQVETKDDSWKADSAPKYSILNNYGIPTGVREDMEAEVRRLKKAGQPCPHCDSNGICSALFIRCGERRQFSLQESREQKNLPHRCHYSPYAPGRHILIVDSEKNIREFCKTTFEIFFKYESDKIITADSAEKAVEILNRFKQENRQVGLAIIASSMPGMSGYDLVNELFNRNFNLDVILLEGGETYTSKPADYRGDTPIVANRAMVVKTMPKPFHSEELIAIIRELFPSILPDKQQ